MQEMNNSAKTRLKLAAAIGTPKTVKVTNQSPPRRRKKDPGPNSAHEYKVSSFRDEYSFTCYKKFPSEVKRSIWRAQEVAVFVGKYSVLVWKWHEQNRNNM